MAIPARNEATRIGAALEALAAQPHADSSIAAAIVHANNCTDATAAVARSVALPFPLIVIEAVMPSAESHIGHARRAVTEAAVAHLLRLGRPDGIVAGTDADSRVAGDWLGRLLAAFVPQIDAVCGVIALDGPISAPLARVREAEAEYAAMVARVTDWLDPLDHDPWPNHVWSWGANFAVRASTLSTVGGSPLVDLAEDRALHAALVRHDARIRHACDVQVFTSARADGRAPGGLADLLSDYATDQDALADFALEPAATTWDRAARRVAARARWGSRPGFGAAWAAQEAETPRLARQRVAVRALPAQTALLGRWLKDAADRSDSRVPLPGAGLSLQAAGH
ncbi:glycosyltransferase [Polymorphobacter multimanifer]|uniref:glycosyltransferase n=1 Tax=Polymorphobacter multimanifer TaxID=1070431 RepID=UPI001A9C8378